MECLFLMVSFLRVAMSSKKHISKSIGTPNNNAKHHDLGHEKNSIAVLLCPIFCTAAAHENSNCHTWHSTATNDIPPMSVSVTPKCSNWIAITDCRQKKSHIFSVYKKELFPPSPGTRTAPPAPRRPAPPARAAGCDRSRTSSKRSL